MCARQESILSRISLPYRLLYPRMLFLIVRLQRIFLLNEIFYFSFVCIPQAKYIINEPFPRLFSGFLTLCLKISFSIDAIKMLEKATAILVPMTVPCVWR